MHIKRNAKKKGGKENEGQVSEWQEEEENRNMKKNLK